MTRFELLASLNLFDPKNPVDVETTVQALDGLSDEQIKEALVFHKMNSPYPIKVFHIVQYWKTKSGQSNEILEQKASLIFERYFKHPRIEYDHVTSDQRIVFAFKIAFGSLFDYGRRKNFIAGVDKKDFIKTYVNARQEDYERAGYVIEGMCHDTYQMTGEAIVVAIDQQAMSIAQQLYSPNVKFVNLKSESNALTAGQSCLQIPIAEGV